MMNADLIPPLPLPLSLRGGFIALFRNKSGAGRAPVPPPSPSLSGQSQLSISSPESHSNSPLLLPLLPLPNVVRSTRAVAVVFAKEASEGTAPRVQIRNRRSTWEILANTGEKCRTRQRRASRPRVINHLRASDPSWVTHSLLLTFATSLVRDYARACVINAAGGMRLGFRASGKIRREDPVIYRRIHLRYAGIGSLPKLFSGRPSSLIAARGLED